MGSSDRRTLLRNLSAGAVAIFTGCTELGSQTRVDRPVDSRETATEAVRTEGDPIYVSKQESSETDTEDALRTAISNRSDCLEWEIPISEHNSGQLVTTKTIVKPTDGNIHFPSQAHRHLKQVTPRSIIFTSAKTQTIAEKISVYIKAVLQYGDSEKIIPGMKSDC